MAPGPDLVSAQDLVVEADYGQIYVWSEASGYFSDAEIDQDNPPELMALNDAVESGRFVGTCSGLIDIVVPGQWNFETPVRLEIWSGEPADDRDDWDHEVDVDFDVPAGDVSFQASGGGRTIPAGIPAGGYRVRVSGRGFTELGYAGADGEDSYRLRLWPREQDEPSALRKRWPGWDGYQ
jgi:hypothetical protein